VKFMSNVLIINRSSLQMPDGGRRAYYSNTNVICTYILIKKKTVSQKSSYVTLLLVSQNALYDTKFEKNLQDKKFLIPKNHKFEILTYKLLYKRK
jgi:hypothetical protein